MARRLYLGRLPPDTRSDDVNKFFDGFGRIVDCRVMTGFGFVEFESSRDAEDALNHFRGKQFLGQDIVLEFAKESRPRPVDDRTRVRRPPGHRLVVSGVSRDTSWQDLKDFGREAGNVTYADIDRDRPGEGVLEYLSREEAERAAKELDGRDLRGRPVRVNLDETVRDGGDDYRRDSRRSPPPRRDYDDRRGGYDDRRGGGYDDRRGGHDDRRGAYDDRRDDRAGGSARARSRSPPRGGDDRRRSPPPRRDYDDRRGAGHDDRRAAPPAAGFEDRRDDRRGSDRGGREDFDRRRDDRRDERMDDRPPRSDDRPPRSANGDAGYTR